VQEAAEHHAFGNRIPKVIADFNGQAFGLPLRRLRIDTIDRIEFAEMTLVERSAYPRNSISALSGRDARDPQESRATRRSRELQKPST
jgi:hypothetical protein